MTSLIAEITVEQKLDAMLVSGYPLTADQKGGMLKLDAWLKTAKVKCKQYTNKPPVFRLYGLGGTGKTTCSVAIRKLGLNPLYVSFTNRAVNVLASKGCVPCATIHSVLYDCDDNGALLSPEGLAMQKEYLDAVEAGIPPSERPPLPVARSSVGFIRREWREIREKVAEYDCIVVDEASMVGQTMGEDLEFIGLPIIGIGDPGQLPPVGDWPFFDPKRPDVLLKKVLRTDGDILEIAAHVRLGGKFNDKPKGIDYEVRRRADPSWFNCQQVLCGIHDKRRELNKHMRKLLGYWGFVPNIGEKICCVSNSKEYGVTNGSLWTVAAVEVEGDYAMLDLLEYSPSKDPKELELVPGVPVHITCFVQDIKNRDDLPINVRWDSVLATWGYAITVHKAQGSEWASVLLFDDSHIFRDAARQWAYTGATRAAKKLYVVSRT